MFRKISSPIVVVVILALIVSYIVITQLSPERLLIVRSGYGVELGCLVGLLLLATLVRGRIGGVLQFGVILGLFALPLLASWSNGVSDHHIIGGLLPWVDAGVYFRDAGNLLLGERLSSFSSRPLFPGMLAALLGISGNNLQVTLAIMVGLTSTVCFFLFREIQSHSSRLVGFISVVIIFLFYRRFIGSTMSENLGLPLGIIGFSCLWCGARRKETISYFFGLFFLTLGLIARPGAFFVLPMLLAWGIWQLRDTRFRPTYFIFLGIGVITLGFAVNQILFRFIASTDAIPFSHYSLVLYGLVKGGLDFGQGIIDHPGANYGELYRLALNEFIDNPLSFFVGIITTYRDYFNPDNGAFGFGFITNIDTNPFSLHLRRLLYFLGVIGFIKCLFLLHDRVFSMIFFAVIGILISIIFLPTSGTDLMRIHAATIPFMAGLVSVVFMRSSSDRNEDRLIHQSERIGINGNTRALIIVGICLTLLCTVAPLIIRGVTNSIQYDSEPCNDGLTQVFFHKNIGSTINIVNNDRSDTRVPNIRVSDFHRGLIGPISNLYPKFSAELGKIPAGNSIMMNAPYSIVAITEQIPEESGLVSLCVRTSAQSRLSYLESIELVQETSR